MHAGNEGGGLAKYMPAALASILGSVAHIEPELHFPAGERHKPLESLDPVTSIGDRRQELVFIGIGLDKAKLTAALQRGISEAAGGLMNLSLHSPEVPTTSTASPRCSRRNLAPWLIPTRSTANLVPLVPWRSRSSPYSALSAVTILKKVIKCCFF